MKSRTQLRAERLEAIAEKLGRNYTQDIVIESEILLAEVRNADTDFDLYMKLGREAY